MNVGYIVIDFLTNKPVHFQEVNKTVPVPVAEDPLRSHLIRVNDEYIELFIKAIREKGWYLRKS